MLRCHLWALGRLLLGEAAAPHITAASWALSGGARRRASLALAMLSCGACPVEGHLEMHMAVVLG